MMPAMSQPSKRYAGIAGFDIWTDDVATPAPVPDPTRSLRENHELVQDLCRYAEGICTESAVRKRWRLSEETWELLGADDELVLAIDKARTQRVRSGALKRELAQGHIIRGPAALASIMDDPRANHRHKVDAVKALNSLADPGPEAEADQERVHIVINLGSDVRAAGQTPDPSNIIEIEATPRSRTPKQIENSDDEWQR
jgi:hypothetical protein